MGLFDAWVGHPDEDVGVLLEVDHQFLLLLHVAELILVDTVRIVEEKIVLTCQLHFNLVDLALSGAMLQ